jgi:hypothetical protein
VADASALAAMLATVTQDVRSVLTVQAGQVQLTATVPAYTVQAVEVRAP